MLKQQTIIHIYIFFSFIVIDTRIAYHWANKLPLRREQSHSSIIIICFGYIFFLHFIFHSDFYGLIKIYGNDFVNCDRIYRWMMWRVNSQYLIFWIAHETFFESHIYILCMYRIDEIIKASPVRLLFMDPTMPIKTMVLLFLLFFTKIYWKIINVYRWSKQSSDTSSWLDIFMVEKN